MNQEIHIREMTRADAGRISKAFLEQGWNKPVSLYTRYFQESQKGRRTVLIADHDGSFAGYVTIVWDSSYPPFHDQGIPEIADFNVLWKYRRRGIGSLLMEAAEGYAAKRTDSVGLGVGLTADYGAAQILYVRRGYIPDGAGISQHGRHFKYGDRVQVDDDLVLYFTKSLSKEA